MAGEKFKRGKGGKRRKGGRFVRVLGNFIDFIEAGKCGVGLLPDVLILCISYLGVKVGDFNGLFTYGGKG
jgi:hypothetical protein